MATSLTQKMYTVSRGHHYTYYTQSRTVAGGKPKQTILLLHGWPDDASVWANVITNTFLPRGYGVIAPDCLGWGGSSKPLDEKDYDFQLMCKDLSELLDVEGLGRVVVSAHDWGACLASRFYNFYPERVLALILTNTHYFPPSTTPFSLDDLLGMSQQAHGYGVFWYWYFFISDDGPQIMTDHIESVWTILHGEGDIWRYTFCQKDGFKDYLLADRKTPLRPYATEEKKRIWVEKMQTSEGGFTPGFLWYRALANGVQDRANNAAAENLVIKVPYLLVRGDSDVCCLPADHLALKGAGLLGDDAEEEVVNEGAHWVMLSHPKQYGERIVSWLERKGF